MLGAYKEGGGEREEKNYVTLLEEEAERGGRNAAKARPDITLHSWGSIRLVHQTGLMRVKSLVLLQLSHMLTLKCHYIVLNIHYLRTDLCQKWLSGRVVINVK